MSNQRALIVVTGIMAAGKSTMARLLAQNVARGVHIEVDVLQRMIVSGGQPGEPGGEAAQQIACVSRICACLADRSSRQVSQLCLMTSSWKMAGVTYRKIG